MIDGRVAGPPWSSRAREFFDAQEIWGTRVFDARLFFGRQDSFMHKVIVGLGRVDLNFLRTLACFKNVYLLVRMAGPPWSYRARDFFLVFFISIF